MSNQAPPPPPGDQPYGNRPPGDQPPGGYQQGGQYPPQQGGQYPPQQGGYQEQPARGKGLAVAALVVGVLALLSSLTVVGGIVLGIIGLVLGVIASGKAKRGQASGRGMAVVGIVLSILGILTSVLLVVGALTFLNSETGQNLKDCLEQAGSDQAAVDECTNTLQDTVENNSN